MESPSCNHCCSGKDISITYSECVPIALSIKHAISMLHIFICGLSGYTMFFTLFHKRYDFRKSSIEHKTCVRIFFTILSETFLILRRIQQDIIINVRKSSCKVGIYSCQILWDKNFIKKKIGKLSNAKFNENPLLPAFHVQVLICTSDSGSNPERALYR